MAQTEVTPHTTLPFPALEASSPTPDPRFSHGVPIPTLHSITPSFNCLNKIKKLTESF